jgi:hypothetical protein
MEQSAVHCRIVIEPRFERLDSAVELDAANPITGESGIDVANPMENCYHGLMRRINYAFLNHLRNYCH